MTLLQPHPRYSITVPSFADSYSVLNELCETFITESQFVRAETALMLRLSVSEACRNALHQPTAAGRLSLVKLSFFGGNPKAASLRVEITDAGTGFPVGGFKPPYRSFQVGTEQPVITLLGQQVVALVESPIAVRLRAKPAHEQTPKATVPERGLGVLALCRCWEDVLFHYDEQHGTTLTLARPLLSAGLQ